MQDVHNGVTLVKGVGVYDKEFYYLPIDFSVNLNCFKIINSISEKKMENIINVCT